MSYNLSWLQRGTHSLFYLVPPHMVTEGKEFLKGSGGKPLRAHPSKNSRNTAVSEFDLRTPVIQIPSIHTIIYTVPSSQTLCSLSQSPCLDIIIELSLIPQRLADFILLEKLGLKF